MSPDACVWVRAGVCVCVCVCVMLEMFVQLPSRILSTSKFVNLMDTSLEVGCSAL